MKPIEMTLTKTERYWLCKTLPEHRSRGGFQGYMVQLQAREKANNGDLLLTDVDLDKIRSYSTMNLGSGGYQGRLRKIFGRTLQHLMPWLKPHPGDEIMPQTQTALF